jgi:hypothetical protein
MHEAEVYDVWESSRPHFIPRSYLYPLTPIGVGTAAVESLTGYISRLATAHAVETGILINHELRPRIPCTKGAWAGRVRDKLPEYSFYVGAYALNGVGTRAQLWVSLLQQLTCIERLNLLTTLPWAGTVSCVHLLHTTRAWCPSCYGDENSSAQTVYERLLWAFQMVTVCPVHRLPLESICPFCGRRQYVLASGSRPGYCSRCYRWLGRASDPSFFHSDLTEQIVVAEMVGALLAASPALPAGFGLNLLRDNVLSFVRDAGGYRRFHAGSRRPHVRDWVRRADIPRMSSLLKLCHSQNVPLIRLLTERIENANKPDQKFSWKAHYRVAGGIMEVALQAALRASIPPPLQEIANQLGYLTLASLQYRYPELCREIAQRRRTAVNTFRPSSNKAPVPRDLIEKALIAELSKPGFTDLRTVAASVGLSGPRRLYRNFRDLLQSITAKNVVIKKRRRETIGAALKAAFNEQPVPTVADVAQRLGYATVKPVTSRFPKLTVELRACRQRIRRVMRGHRGREGVRQRLTEALVELPPPACAEVVRRLGGHRTQIREDFPDLWRALRERYVQHVQEVHRAKREAFAGEVYRAVMELHRQGVYPIVRLVLASIPHPQFRCLNIVAEAVRRARHELSIKPYEAHRGQA